jgi:hypothetical protein
MPEILLKKSRQYQALNRLYRLVAGRSFVFLLPFSHSSRSLPGFSLVAPRSRGEVTVYRLLKKSSLLTVNYKKHTAPVLLEPAISTLNLTGRIISGLDTCLKLRFKPSEMKGM